MRVDFFAGSTLIGSDTASPFTVTWSGAAAGTHALTAAAYDPAGLSTTSTTVNIVVKRFGTAHASRVQRVLEPRDIGRALLAGDLHRRRRSANRDAGADAEPWQADVADGAECTLDIASTISSLPSSTYIAAVSAVGSGGVARGARFTALHTMTHSFGRCLRSGCRTAIV